MVLKSSDENSLLSTHIDIDAHHDVTTDIDYNAVTYATHAEEY